MRIVVSGPLTLSATYGLADVDGELDPNLGQGGSMKMKFADLDELSQWVQQVQAPETADAAMQG